MLNFPNVLVTANRWKIESCKSTWLGKLEQAGRHLAKQKRRLHFPCKFFGTDSLSHRHPWEDWVQINSAVISAGAVQEIVPHGGGTITSDGCSWPVANGAKTESCHHSPVGQPAVMALSAVPCWERWFCPVQGGKEERLELKRAWWDVGIQVGCSELLGCAEECTGMSATTFDTYRPQNTDGCIIYQI